MNLAQTLINFRNAEKSLEVIERVVNEEILVNWSYEIELLSASHNEFYILFGMTYTVQDYASGRSTEFYQEEFPITPETARERILEMMKRKKTL